MTKPAIDIRDWITKFILHVATGVLAVVVHYGLMALALYLEFMPLLASSIGFLGGALTRFFTAYFHVFSPSQGIRLAMPKFIAALCFQMLGNYLLLAGLMGAGVDLWLAQIMTTLLLTIFNYLMYRLWVFR
jgi:putative flippase GtrA